METDPKLSIELVWQDVHMTQLRITASNGVYCGAATVYFAHGETADLAKTIRGFPKTTSQVEIFEGGTDTGARARLVFHCVDQWGHPAVRVSLADFAYRNEQPPIMNEVDLELRFDAFELDKFCRELDAVAAGTRELAVLHGTTE